MSEAYGEQLEPSKYLAHRLDSFMHLFSFVRESTPEDIEKLPRYGFRLSPDIQSDIRHVIGFTLNSFPYFMMTRIFPYLHYYHDYSEQNEIVFTIIYFDFYINYVIDIQQMQLACPVNIKDLQSCKADIKHVSQIIRLDGALAEICMNQPTFPRLALQDFI